MRRRGWPVLLRGSAAGTGGAAPTGRPRPTAPRTTAPCRECVRLVRGPRKCGGGGAWNREPTWWAVRRGAGAGGGAEGGGRRQGPELCLPPYPGLSMVLRQDRRRTVAAPRYQCGRTGRARGGNRGGWEQVLGAPRPGMPGAPTTSRLLAPGSALAAHLQTCKQHQQSAISNSISIPSAALCSLAYGLGTPGHPGAAACLGHGLGHGLGHRPAARPSWHFAKSASAQLLPTTAPGRPGRAMHGPQARPAAGGALRA